MKKMIERIRGLFCWKSKQMKHVVNELGRGKEVIAESVTVEELRTREEVILEYLRGPVSFNDVVQFMAHDDNIYFKHDSDIGKQVCETLTTIGKKRAEECTSFQEGFLIYDVDLGPLTRNFHHPHHCGYLIWPICQRIYKLAEQQRNYAEQKMDLATLQNLLLDAKRVSFWNFWVPFRNSIWTVVVKKLEGARDIDGMIGIYKEAKDAGCEIAMGHISEALAEFLMRGKQFPPS
ncbi:MAG: hypothetical protein NUW00_05680 [Candidatus Kaiserbacteria bacterium]|nr:hypothetical protein [Candidatus Kaiserbacteria bacterium]